MEFTSLGKIGVPTPGTPVPLTADASIRAACIIVCQIGGTTGRVLFGKAGLNKTSLAGAIRTFLPAGASGLLDHIEIHSHGAGNRLQPSEFVIDADTAGEGVLVSYGTA